MVMASSNKWDLHFIKHARLSASMSKDPSTKVGAVIVDDYRRIVGSGFNGFPRGVPDRPEDYENKEVKYKMVMHAEINAILNANQLVKGCTIYCTFCPCAQCAGFIIQAGIAEVKYLLNPERDEAWKADQDIGKWMLGQAGIKMSILNENAEV